MSLTAKFTKRAGDFTLQVDIHAPNGVLALFGPSGSGKSMTLRCIAGVDTPDEGVIIADGITVFDSSRRINLPPQKRRIGLLFQDYALFPIMTVEQNVALALGRKDPAQIREILHRCHVADVAKLHPRKLSGGQQRRVAFARMMASDPSMVLLDEPFSALDESLSRQMETELHQQLGFFGGTVVLVSHDRRQVRRLADYICVLDNGVTQPVVTAEELFDTPTTRSAALLAGWENFLPLHGDEIQALRSNDFAPQGEIPFILQVLDVIPEMAGATVVAKTQDNIAVYVAWDHKWDHVPLPKVGETFTACVNKKDLLHLKG